MTKTEIITLRRQGLTVGEIADIAKLSTIYIHHALKDQPRNIRYRGTGIGESAPTIKLNKGER